MKKNKVKYQNKSHRYSRSAVVLILLPGLFIVLVSLFLILSNWSFTQDIRSKAAEDPSFCQDKCIGQDRCGNGPPGDPNYNDPCCEDIRRTGDPFACAWPQRGYCTDDQCASIPEGVNKQRCGGPRHSWCNLCRDNQCPGYVNVNTSPTSPPPPTNPPRPSATPILPSVTNFPTSLPPTLPPSERPSPYNSPTLIPTFPPLLSVYPSTTYISPTYYLPPTYSPWPSDAISPNLPVVTSVPTIVQFTPTPTSIPIINVVVSDIGNWVQKTKESILQFLLTVLP